MRQRNVNPLLMFVILMLILNVVRGGNFLTWDWLETHLLMLPGILIGLCFHEFAHAFVSDRLGDPTPRMQGRVTIDPRAHVDPVGFLALLFAGFGWGRPVQIDPRYYKHRRRDEALVAVAGVTMNLLLALLFTILFKILVTVAPSFFSTSAGRVVLEMLQYAILINIVLMVFNLIPCPPLDGFNLATQIFGLQKYKWWYKVMQYGNLVLIALILLDVTDMFLGPAVSFVYGLMSKIIFL